MMVVMKRIARATIRIPSAMSINLCVLMVNALTEIASAMDFM